MPTIVAYHNIFAFGATNSGSLIFASLNFALLYVRHYLALLAFTRLYPVFFLFIEPGTLPPGPL